MRIEGLSAGTSPKSGTLVFVSGNVIWDIVNSKVPLQPFLEALQKEKVLTGDPLKSRALNTKVLAFGWIRPKSPDDLARQRASLETHGKAFKEIFAFDIDGINKTVVEDSPTNYLDGGELVVQVARKYPERIGEVLPFIRDPQRPDWIFDDLFEAALGHKDPKKELMVYEALLSFPVPAGSNRYRPTYLQALNNALVTLNTMKDAKRAKALADRARPFLKENPYLTHSTACAYAMNGDLESALEMIGFAVKFKYEKLDSLKKDPVLAKVRALAGYDALFGASPAVKKAPAAKASAVKKKAPAAKKKSKR